jgi:lysophospholipase L1-like esterase
MPMASAKKPRDLPRALVFGVGCAAIPLAVICSAAAQPADPCPDVAPLQTIVERQRRQLNDWGGLIRYGSENTELPKPAAGEGRVVFLGDDITEAWTQFFPGKPYLNRGIRRQTSGQMLLRFRQDVISLKPKVVVIQAGANDLAGFSGPATQPMIAENFMSMVELAKANGIRVVLASLTPVCDCPLRQTQIRPVGKIMGVNEWLKNYASETGSVYLDYYPALAEGRALKKEYTLDGFLLNAAAYAAMAPLAERAIAEALGRK